MKRFSNFSSATVTNTNELDMAFSDLRESVDDQLLQTRIGKEFSFDEIDAAMCFEAAPGAKAVLGS